MATPEQIKANRENSKKRKKEHLTGRPVLSATLQTQYLKAQLQKYLQEHLPEMFDAQVKKAKEGDTPAFIAIMDRAYGKPAQALTGPEGESLFPTVNEKEKANEVLIAYLDR